MKFRRKEVVEAEQWFPGKDVPGVFLYQPDPVRLHDRMGGFSDFPQDPYYAARQSNGKIFRVGPGDWVIAEPDGVHYEIRPDDLFRACYEPME